MEEHEFLQVKIDLPNFKIDLHTHKPITALGELRKIVEKLPFDDVLYEEFALQELRAKLSDEFLQNEKVMGQIKELLAKEEEYFAQTITIPITATIDLEANTRCVNVKRTDVQRAITTITQQFDPTKVKQGIIHVNGDLDRNDRVMIVDHIHRAMPTANLRAFQSMNKKEHVSIECVFFGSFESAP